MNIKIISKINVFIITFLIFATGVFGVYYKILRAPIPSYEDTFVTSTIKNNIKIFYDENKIPNIVAKNDLDAAFGLGFAHARERMFQMDIYRRAAEGRLSEVFGIKTLKFDKMFRTLDFESTVADMMKNLSKEELQFLKAYADGINFYLEEQFDKSIEFDLLGYNPEKWEIKHTLLLTKLLAWELNISWWSDVAFANLYEKVGSEKLKEIVPDYPDGKNSNNLYLAGALEELNNFYKCSVDYKEFSGFKGTNIGSNNWVVSGNKSINGKPIIANDPHLAFQAPGKWFLANIYSGEKLSVKGFTMAGLPLVIIGLNNDISWVLTNIMCDDADFYIEKLDSTKSKYFYNGKWRNLEIKSDTIKVKNENDYEFVIRKTHRGPIISNSHPFYEKYTSNNAISMRWTALEFHNEFKSFYKINYARNWEEFKEALSYYSTPGQNFVYADKKGNIGYIMGAKIPKRKYVSSVFVYDGTKKESDWVGFYDYTKNLKMLNPSKGFIATANNKLLKKDKIYISNIWEPSARIERINELLSSKEKFNVDDFKKFQNDYKSKYSEKIILHLLNAFKNVKINDKNISLSLKLLYGWDNVFSKSTQSPLIYSKFFNKLLENIYKDEMGDELYKQFIFMSNIPYRVTINLLDKGYSYWFDNINTTQIESKETILRKSFIQAVKELEGKFGDDISLWQWGKVHKIKFKHLFSGQHDIVDRLVDIGPYEVGGELTTINNGSYSLVKPYDVNIGPSMRFIYDFSEPDRYYYILTTGQSGHIFSEYYKNQTKDYLEGKYRISVIDTSYFNKFQKLEIMRGNNESN